MKYLKMKNVILTIALVLFSVIGTNAQHKKTKKQPAPDPFFDRIEALAKKASNPDIPHEGSVVARASRIVGQGNAEQSKKAMEGPVADFSKNLNTPTQSQIKTKKKK